MAVTTPVTGADCCRNAATRLTHAWGSLVDENGRILVPGLLPDSLPEAVKKAVQNIPVGQGPNDPQICLDWGEPGLSPAERVFGWNTLEILSMKAGNPESPANAIPGSATLHAQIRYVVGSDSNHFLEHIKAHLLEKGFDDVEVKAAGVVQMEATRLNPDDPWVDWILDSVARTTGKQPTLLPNLGGSLPNDCFAKTLGLPTVWIPHSYPACLQHGPNEHMLGSVAKEALQMMTGVFWELAEIGSGIKEKRNAA
ncbi:peptidase dimerization domain-containing protein [Vibrio sp. CDRSL-10 TSBA]